jgi:hypothetical protein
MSPPTPNARSVLTLGALLLLLSARPASAGLGCENLSGPDCGNEVGDARCAADFDCIDTGNNGCQCRPRICCKCETEPGTTNSGGGCDLPCTQTGIGFLVCVGACVAIDELTQDSCNLKVVNQALCADGSCPTTGCCSFNEQSQATTSGPAPADLCVETDEASCDLVSGQFVADGSCAGGLSGTCVSPTPTSTATHTPTATATATSTATNTATATGTSTRTPQPNGADCTSGTECASTFCVDDVCCNSACAGPFDTCDAPPEPGVCVQVAPAPPVSRRGLFTGLALLTLIGAAALWHQRRDLRGSNA